MRADSGQLSRDTPAGSSRGGERCERFVQSHIEEGHSFAVETTLRTRAAIEQAHAARARGLATEMIFVAIAEHDTDRNA
jgi:predicted ABC-type ATPase